jgi:hypothetical protein
MKTRNPHARLERSPETRIRALALGLVLGMSAGAAPACGLEDPSSIAFLRGTLQLAYPEALHVGTAVWQAQLDGTLPRDALAQRADLSPEARATLRLVKANAMLRRLAARLNLESGLSAHRSLAIVLLGPVLWSRFETADGALKASVHVKGPEQGDVVVVTDTAVIEAIADGDLNFAEALERRVARLYGSPEAVAVARQWLVASP